MPEIPLETLRDLRRRAAQLLENVGPDLRVFLHKDNLTFRRKPDSKSRKKDVNVTTTCSCVMALALTNQFHRFYYPDPVKKDGSDDAIARKILKSLIEAPWMSSGLTSNNAFTTALVLRTYGFLKDYKLTDAVPPKKRWDLELNLSNQAHLLSLLKQGSDPTALFLFRSLSDATRDQLEQFSPAQNGSTIPPELTNALTADIRRIIHSSSIYSPDRFPVLSRASKQSLSKNPYSYDRAELNHRFLAEAFKQSIQAPSERSFTDIANLMAQDEKHFRINEYPPAVPVMYWFVDGVSRGNIDIEEGLWSKLCKFASKEFDHQRSLVLAEHHAMMDPIAMGMAACLCARLSVIVRNKKKGKGMSLDALPTMPSMGELVHTIKEVFRHQTSSGIWPKYFPMFHYQEAGSNFCFTFELLEAILHEFADTEDTVAVSNELLNDTIIIEKLDNAVTWCEQNRLETFDDGVTYKGWNSGGELKSLTRSQPESWATAVVHMFLWELKNVLSSHIQRRLLDKYKSTAPKSRTPQKESFSEFLDIELSIKGHPESLIHILKEELVQVNGKRNEADVRREGLKQPRSALLFGPPGTSKTRLTTALAESLFWPLIVISPSDFVKKGFENVYLEADEIFRDINDLSAVVVFFDEMDPLMQSREGTELDTPTQFLTTSMLPQITKLYDRGRVVFLMATNYKSRFDPALLRSGRFDLLLCMGPPTLAEKVNRLSMFFKPKGFGVEQEKKAKLAILDYAKKDSWIYSQLELLTFAEFGKFLSSCGSRNNIGIELRRMGQRKFKNAVLEYSKDVTLRMGQLPSKLQRLCPKWDMIPSTELNNSKTLLTTEIGKYLLDRKESKKQY